MGVEIRTMKAIAAYLGIDRSTLYDYISRGMKLPIRKMGGVAWAWAHELDAWKMQHHA